VTSNQTKKENEQMKKLMSFLKNEEGVTAIEYGLIATLIAVAIVGTVTAVGTALNGTFSTVNTKLGG
jgi:pilus assembly protein Flp/PilA